MKYRLCLAETRFDDPKMREESRTVYAVNSEEEAAAVEDYNIVGDCGTCEGQSFVKWISDWVEYASA